MQTKVQDPRFPEFGSNFRKKALEMAESIRNSSSRYFILWSINEECCQSVAFVNWAEMVEANYNYFEAWQRGHAGRMSRCPSFLNWVYDVNNGLMDRPKIDERRKQYFTPNSFTKEEALQALDQKSQIIAAIDTYTAISATLPWSIYCLALDLILEDDKFLPSLMDGDIKAMLAEEVLC